MADWNQIVADYEAKIVRLEAELVAHIDNEVKVYKINLIAAGVAFFLGLVIGLSF